jgi:tripartite-type tricarboxylate transporter receptor subunit TctC
MRKSNMKVLHALAIVTASVLLTPGAPRAQEPYPNKPVKVIVPFAPGGPSDVTARIIFNEMSKNVGKQFFIENHAGAGANIGITLAARAAPDGYTVLLSSSSLWLNPSTYSKVAYDPSKDFEPISLVATTPNSLVVHPSVPVKTAKELVDLIRAEPGKHTFAIPGMGTPPHLSGALFRLAMNLDMTPVPFNGGGPMIQSVVAGHTPIAFSSMPPAAPQIRAGTIRALAVTALKRSNAVPDVPTMTEAGYPGQEGDTPQGMLVPAGTPQPIVEFLYRELMKVLQNEDVKTKLAAAGLEIVGNNPKEFAKVIVDDGAKWAKVVKDAGIKLTE